MYRDGVSIYNGPNTTNQFTDNTQLNINTVYEYSVVAISCAGNSTAGVKSVSIESEIAITYTLQLSTTFIIVYPLQSLHYLQLLLCLSPLITQILYYL